MKSLVRASALPLQPSIVVLSNVFRIAASVAELGMLDCCPQTEAAHERYIVWRNCRDAPTLWTELLTAVRRLQIWLRPRRNERRRVSCQTLNGLDHRLSIVLSENLEVQTCPAASSSTLLQVVEPSRSGEFRLSGVQAEAGSTPVNSEPASNVLNILELSAEPPLRGADSDEPPEAAAERIMREQFRLSMTSQTRYEGDRYSGAFLRGKMADIAMQRAANGSIWDTSHPFLSLLCKPWFPRILLAMAIYELVSFGLGIQQLRNNGLIEGLRFRFITLEMRDGSTPSNGTGPGIAYFGLLLDGCDDTPLTNSTTFSNEHATLQFPAPTTVNGFYFVTASQPLDRDPVRFVLERSVDAAGDTWDVVGSSAPIWTWAGTPLWDTGEHPTISARGATEEFFLTVPWVWYFRRLTSTALLFLTSAFLAAASTFKRHSMGKLIASSGMALHAAINALAALLFVLYAMPDSAFVAVGFAIIDVCFTLALLTSERALRHCVGFAGIGYLSLVIVHYSVLLGEPGELVVSDGLGLVQNTGLPEGLLCLALFAAAQLSRRRSRQRALAIIQEDKAAYDACWSGLCGDETSVADFKEMREYTDHLQARLQLFVEQPVRPTLSSHEAQGIVPVEYEQINEGVGDGRLIHRLEQLFAQAAVLDVFLRAKCKQWALQSEGCFQVAVCRACTLAKFNFLQRKLTG